MTRRVTAGQSVGRFVFTVRERFLSESGGTLPTSTSARIVSLDVLRGFALLGILIMNMQSFAMIDSAYMNPTVLGPVEGIEGTVWLLTHLLADSKFISIFSMLFGAGIVLMAERRSVAGKSAASLHYRRMLGLLVIGLIHSYLFWHGDILVSYAVCGAVVMVARRWSPRWQVVTAAALLLVGAGVIWFFGWSIPYWDQQGRVEVRDHFWQPSPELIAKELAIYRGSWWDLFLYRTESTAFMQFFVLPTMLFWHVSGLMLIGMALYKSGILSGGRSVETYRTMLAVGLGLGLPLITWGAWLKYQGNWDFEYSMFQGTLPNYFGSLAVAIGYIGGLLLLLRSSWATVLTRSLAPVGQMALTNYLSQTIVCTTLFYGWGLGLFGRVSRVQQLLVVVVIWGVQIVFSIWWMKRFRFGPLEYIWRVASYGAIPAFRRKAEA